MGKEIVNQVQEAQSVPGRINPRRNTLRHIVIKLTKIKDKDKINIKRNKGKMTNNIKGNSHQAISYFSTVILQARREWHDIFKVMKGKNLQPRTLYLSFRFDEKSKAFQTSKS